MNTTMADGAEQRLDAQIAEALFGQPGMSKMDVANRVRELRGNGPALLVGRQPGGRVRLGDQLRPCPFCGHSDFDQWPCEYIDASGANVVRCAHCHGAAPMKVWHALSAQPQYITDAYELGMRDGQALSAQPSPSSIFDLEGMLAACVPGGDIADPQVIADNIRDWFAAHPSPGGQGDAITPAMVDAAAGTLAKWAGHDDGSRWVHEARDALVAALAARQPVALIAQKVGDYRVTVAEDAITVSHGRDIVFAYSAGDADPINARQPVGEPVAWLVHWSDMPLESLEVTRSASRISEVSALTNPPRIVPLYAAPPAEPVDLGAVCQLAKKWMRIGGEDARFCAGELLTLIDGKAVGK